MERDTAETPDFDTIVQLYRPRIFRFALASLRDRDAAETVTQDCFLKAFRAWNGFRGDCAVQSWLMQIAVNLVRDVGRNRRLKFWKRARTVAVDVDIARDWIPDRGLSPEARAAGRQQVEAIWSVIETLSERQRTVFLLHFLEEMTPAEIEAAAGIPKGAARVHLWLIFPRALSTTTPEGPLVAFACCFTSGFGFILVGGLATFVFLSRPNRFTCVTAHGFASRVARAPLLVPTLARLHAEQAIYMVNSFQFTRSQNKPDLLLAHRPSGSAGLCAAPHIGVGRASSMFRCG